MCDLVYPLCVPLVQVCIFSYGQTGTGKTHTMLGSMAPEQRGIIPRSIDLLFEAKKELEGMGWKYKIRVSWRAGIYPWRHPLACTPQDTTPRHTTACVLYLY